MLIFGTFLLLFQGLFFSFFMPIQLIFSRRNNEILFLNLFSFSNSVFHLHCLLIIKLFLIMERSLLGLVSGKKTILMNYTNTIYLLLLLNLWLLVACADITGSRISFLCGGRYSLVSCLERLGGCR